MVYLVGAGPGDPGLLTLRGKQALERATVVFYDHLAPESLLDFAPAAARRIYVGKKHSDHAMAQDEIVRQMLEEARNGATVVRLKGGDPLVFGRGGEEAEALADAGIAFEIIPGVTTPLGIAAYSGVPLTHRDFNREVTLITGHDPARIEWPRVALADTLVIFMGLSNAAEIVTRMIQAGRSASTPAMAVRWATRPDQETVRAPLGHLPQAIADSGLKPPATILIGEVTRFGEKLNWFERLPLFGQRVVITRAAGQASEASALLRELGAEPVEFPTIAIEPAADPTPLDQAIARLADYGWVIFTSVNGVRYFLDRLDRSSHDLRQLRARICAIGPATRAAVEALHLKVDVTPDEYVAEALATALAPFDLEGAKVLLPRAAVARDTLPTELTRRGAHVDVVEAYRTVVPKSATGRWREIAAKPVDWITFTSSSTVKNFLALAGRDAIGNSRIASIGPVTSATLRAHGLSPDAEARDYTIPGLLQAIAGYKPAP